jgi:phage replication O-like protein O
MANPQAENGHTDIANDIAEALARTRLSGEETQALWVVLRKTYGWHKKQDRISLSQFVQMTGICRQNVTRALKKLESKMILRIKVDSKRAHIYEFMKDFDKWKTASHILGIKTDSKTESKLTRTKETIQKKTTAAGAVAPPYGEIAALYHAALPEAPEVTELTPRRKKLVKDAWTSNELRQDLIWWEGYFEFIAECCPFLKGGGHSTFVADFEWLVNVNNLVNVVSGKYSISEKEAEKKGNEEKQNT